VSQLLDPGSEFHVHHQWYLTTAMDVLLRTNFSVAEKNRLYRCLDRVLNHKQDLFLWLRQKWADLFQAEFEVLLYVNWCVTRCVIRFLSHEWLKKAPPWAGLERDKVSGAAIYSRNFRTGIVSRLYPVRQFFRL
jgi:hypothetical protein